MHGSGTFFDARLGDRNQDPVSAKSGSYNSRGKPDEVTSKLAALQFYQLAIPAPKPPKGSYDEASAARGKSVFETNGKCAACHVPPLYTEPGNNVHAPSEIGVDSFQADRSPTHMYRTAPLAGLWSRQSRGFYHDGRFQTLDDVINHYDQHNNLGLTKAEKQDLVEFLKSL
jgi:cytochrome c peroxidase